MNYKEISKKIIDDLKDKYGEHKVEYAINALEIDWKAIQSVKSILNKLILCTDSDLAVEIH